MERSMSENIEGETFACTKCGNTEFEQECYTKSIEIVNIKKKDNEMIIISKDMLEINAEEIEYNNEFVCPKCKNVYVIGKNKDVDVIYNTDGEYTDG